MKYKPRQDAEFLIVGFKAGTGKMSDQIIFTAKKTPLNEEFFISKDNAKILSFS